MDFKVSAIVNTLNRLPLIEKCVKSLLGQRYLGEIILVDDGSNPPVPTIPGVSRTVRLPETVGVSRSRNIGALVSRDTSTHLFFTDDDIILTPNCLEILCDPKIWVNPNVAAAGGSVPDMNDAEKTTRVWKYNCHPMTIDENGRITDLSEFWVEENRWWSADHIKGGNQLLRRDVFFEVGGFRWTYRVGGFREETDFCLEVKKRGYRLWFNPVARALHYRVAYGGVRLHTALEKEYDNIFRTRWAPLKYLGQHIEYPDPLLEPVGKHESSPH